MKRILVFIIGFLMCLSTSVYPGEFTYPWNFTSSKGGIQDMHFMPGTNESQFICMTEGNFAEIRNTLTGELIEQIPGVQGLFEFTADSQRIVTMMGSKIELRNLLDMSLIAHDSLNVGTDTIDIHGNKMSTRFLGLAIDPIRTYAYAIVQKSNNLDPTDLHRLDTTRIVVYNYNTMKQIKVLNPEGFKTHFEVALIAISKDGKYLAAYTDRETELNIWSLDSMKLIRNFKLYSNIASKWSTPTDLRFSEINTENVFFVGEFPPNQSGLYIYSINLNSILDSTFNKITAGKIEPFCNEQRIFCAISGVGKVLNFTSKRIEYTYNMNIPKAGSWGHTTYSKNQNIFIGWLGNYCSAGLYDSLTFVKDDPSGIKLIFPNPATDFIEISVEVNGRSPLQGDVRIYNVFGQIMSTPNPTPALPASREGVRIDVSGLVPGMYFVRIGDRVSKFVKM